MTQPNMELWQQISKLYPEANFLQSPTWGRVNEIVGHKVITEATDTSWCQMIVKNAKRGRYLEVPGGPLIDWQDHAAVTEIFQQIQSVGRAEKCVFARVRVQEHPGSPAAAQLSALSLRPAPMHLHAEHTVMIDLSLDEAQLLANMRRQTRYEVRRSERLGIRVEYGRSEELFREFHAVQVETAERQHFIPPDLATLLAERKAFGDNARLYVAKTDDGQPIAYGLILIEGAEAEYFEAASTELNHKLPGSYALLWQVMRDLKQLGIKRFNLWGIAPPGVKHHRYSGVTTFKTGFGGQTVEFIAAQDLVLQPRRYLVNLAIEKLRKKMRNL